MRDVTVTTKPERSKAARDTKSGAAMLAGDGTALYSALKALRQQLANEAGLPPYVICHDRTLVELAQKRPQSETALHDITGLGDRKIARYGAALLEVIHAFNALPAASLVHHGELGNRLSTTVNLT